MYGRKLLLGKGRSRVRDKETGVDSMEDSKLLSKMSSHHCVGRKGQLLCGAVTIIACGSLQEQALKLCPAGKHMRKEQPL
jgi:hypothetical protein